MKFEIVNSEFYEEGPTKNLQRFFVRRNKPRSRKKSGRLSFTTYYALSVCEGDSSEVGTLFICLGRASGKPYFSGYRPPNNSSGDSCWIGGFTGNVSFPEGKNLEQLTEGDIIRTNFLNQFKRQFRFRGYEPVSQE